MMTYFELKGRLENLREFRDRYAEYLNFTNRPENPAAQILLKRMQASAAMTVDSLKRIDLGAMLTKDAPARGSKTIRINLIKAVFRDEVIERFNLEEEAPLKILDRGIVRYQARLWRQKVQLFNPVFWLYHIVGLAARLPFLFLNRAGYGSPRVEKLTLVKIYVVLFQFGCYWALARYTGVIAWAKINLQTLF